MPLVNDPGTAREYGSSTDWLGLVIEKLSGQRLGNYLKQHVYGPLGMHDSTFAPSDEQRERLLRVMQRQADGTLAPSNVDLPLTSEWDAAGHGSYGTVQDYGRFLNSYYWIDRSKAIAAVLTTQLLPFFDMPVIETLIGFEMAVYQQVGGAGSVRLMGSRQRDKAAAKCFLRSVLRQTRRRAESLLPSGYPAAKVGIPALPHGKHAFVNAAARANNRAGKCHQPILRP